MSATIHERIAAAVSLALYDPDQAGDPGYETIAGIGERVFRGREDGLTADECDAINITTGDNQTQPFGDALDNNRLEINVAIHVRGHRDWETQTDGYVRPIQQRILAYDWHGAGIQLASIRMGDQNWSADAGAGSPAKRSLTFIFTFLTHADDLTRQA